MYVHSTTTQLAVVGIYIHMYQQQQALVHYRLARGCYSVSHDVIDGIGILIANVPSRQSSILHIIVSIQL